MTAENTEIRMVIDSWRSVYLVPASHPAPEELRGRLDRLAVAEAPAVCARCLEQVLDPGDESIWLIRNLTLELPLNAGRQAEERAARAWGEQLARRIHTTVSREPVGEDVLRFPDRPSYVAHFLADLAAGRAWGKWYYDEFDSLRALPVGRTILEVLRHEPRRAAEAMVRLAMIGRLQEVLATLTVSEAQAIYGVCSVSEGATTDDGIRAYTGTLLELWNEAPLRSAGDNLYRDGLWLFGRAAARRNGAAADPSFWAALHGLLDLRRVLAGIRSAAELDRLVQSLAEVSGEQTSPALEFFARMMQGDAAWGAQAAGVLLSEDFRRRTAGLRRRTGQVLLTTFAGLYRLGRSLIDSGIDEIAAGAEAPGRLRHSIAVTAAGASRLAEAADDPAVRLLTGCDGERDPSEPGSSLAALVQVLVRKGRCRGDCLLVETVTLPGGTKVALLRDVIENEWVWAAKGDSSGPLDEGIALIAAMNGVAPRVIPAGAANVRELADGFGIAPERMSRLLRPAAPDLAWFCADEAALDLTCVMCARAVLRHFSRRLMGFEATRPEYLWANFLECRGTVEEIGDRIEVGLSEAPLSLVLRMAGIENETYHAPWTGREVCLHQQAE